MKMSDIQKALDSYDSNSGIFRTFKDEPHIKKLREFHVTLGDKDRDLTHEELLTLVIIGLGKKSENGSASCQTFDTIFEALGDKNIYAKLQTANLLDKDTVFIITQLASQPGEPIKQLLKEFDSAKIIINSVSQSIRHNSDMGAIINLLTTNKLFNVDILKQLSLVQKDEVSLLYNSLSILNSENSSLLNIKNIKSCIQFSLTPKAIQNLHYLLKTTSKNKHLDQKKIDELFSQPKGMSSFIISKKSIDYLRSVGDDLETILSILLLNNEVDIDKIVEELEKMNLDSHDQTLALRQALLKDYKYHETMLSAVNQLSPGNKSYMNTVISYPEYAHQIAATIELLTSDELSGRFKTIYKNMIKKNVTYAGDLLELLNVFQASGFLIEKNISGAFDNYEKSKDISLCIQCLQNNSVFKQKNIDRLISYRGSMGLLQKTLQILSSSKLLNQKNFDALLDCKNDLTLVVNRLTTLDSDHKLDQINYNLIIKNPTPKSFSGGYKPDSEPDFEYDSGVEFEDPDTRLDTGLGSYSMFPKANPIDKDLPSNGLFYRFF